MERMEAENRALKEANDGLKAKMERMEKRINRPEIEEAKKGIIIRGIYETTRDSESESATRAGSFLKAELGIDENTIASIRRVPLSAIAKEKAAERKQEIYRPALIRFKEVKDKFEVFKNLHKLKGKSSFAHVKVANDIPLCLKQHNDKLEEKARQVRAKGKDEGITVRTRVIFQASTLILQTKRQGESRWSDF